MIAALFFRQPPLLSATYCIRRVKDTMCACVMETPVFITPSGNLLCEYCRRVKDTMCACDPCVYHPFRQLAVRVLYRRVKSSHYSQQSFFCSAKFKAIYLEILSAGESQYENRPRRNLARNTATPRSMNAENVLPYEPGMLLQDRPLVYGSGSDSECGEDNIYTFDHIRPSHRVGPSWNTEITDIKMMVQQQQAMMTSILANQEAMQERQGLYEKKVSQLEEKLVQYSPSSSDASPRTGKKRKRVVNHGVSVSASVFSSNFSDS